MDNDTTFCRNCGLPLDETGSHKTLHRCISRLRGEVIEIRQQRDKAEYDRSYAIGAIKALLVELGEGSQSDASVKP